MSSTAVFTTQPPPTDPALRQPLQVASLMPRLGAYLIDITIVMVVGWIVAFAFLMGATLLAVGANGGEGFSYSSDGSTAGGLLVLSGLYAVSFLPPLAYFVLLPATKGGFNGRTIGKRAVGLQVVGADGTRVTPSAARRRGLAFFGPTFFGLVVGTLLDGIAGTPLIFTGILVTVAAIYSVTDLTFAPASSELRATLHDRAAKTVVVRSAPGFVDPTDEPSAITPRPKTDRLTLLNVAGGLYLLALIAGIVLVVATAGSGSSDVGGTDDTVASIEEALDEAMDEALDEALADADVEVTTDESSSETTTDESSSDTTTDDEPAEPAGTGVAELRPGAVEATLAAANAKSAAGAQRQATNGAVLVANCLGVARDFFSCGGLSRGFTFDLKIEGTPRRDTPTTGRTVVLSKPFGTLSGEMTVLVYDRDNIGWGYRFRKSDSVITPICLSLVRNCEATKAYERFVNDRAAVQSVKNVYRWARNG